MKKSTRRGQALTEKRQAAGWVRLHAWLPPEAVEALDRLRSDGRSRAEVISALLGVRD